MNTQVTLTLSPDSYQRAEHLAKLTERNVNEVLSDSIESLLSPLADSPELPKPISALSDQEVIALTELQLPPEQDRYLNTLLDKQQAGKIDTQEQVELFALMQVYQEGLLRKARSLNEAVKRGLREPLTA